MKITLEELNRKLMLIMAFFKIPDFNPGNNPSTDSTVEISEYDKLGRSKKRSDFGGFKHIKVQSLLAEWIKKGGNHAFVAKGQDEYHCMLEPDYIHTIENRSLIYQNQARMFSLLSNRNIDDLKKLRGRYRNRKTGVEIMTIPTLNQRETGQWDRIRSREISVIENHAVIAAGNFSNPKSIHWKKQLFDKIPEFVLARMKAELALIETADSRS